MSPDVFPSSDDLRMAGDLITPSGPPPELDLSTVAELAAHDAAHRILRVRQAFQKALERIEALETAGLDRELALGGGIERAMCAGNGTAYREAIFKASCAYFDLSCDEAKDYVERYSSVKSAIRK